MQNTIELATCSERGGTPCVAHATVPDLVADSNQHRDTTGNRNDPLSFAPPLHEDDTRTTGKGAHDSTAFVFGSTCQKNVSK